MFLVILVVPGFIMGLSYLFIINQIQVKRLTNQIPRIHLAHPSIQSERGDSDSSKSAIQSEKIFQKCHPIALASQIIINSTCIPIPVL